MNMSSDKTRNTIRFLLLHSENGRTISSLADEMGVTRANIRKVLAKMYGCYVSHWVESQRPEFGGSLAAVWKSVEVPEHAKDPSGRTESIRQYARSRPLDVKKERKLPTPVPKKVEYQPSNKTRWVTPPSWATK
jgi:hypothetical protein